MYTTKQVSAELNVSTRTVQRLIRAQKISVVRVGRQLRIPHESLDDYLARNRVGVA